MNDSVAEQIEQAAPPPDPMTALDPTTLAAKYAEALAECDRLGELATAAGAELRAVAEALKDKFVELGVQNVTACGLNIYLRRDIQVGRGRLLDMNGEEVLDTKGKTVPVPTTMVVERLQEVGGDWGELVHDAYNAQSLAAMVRDPEVCTRDGDDLPMLPPELADLLVPVELFSIRHKKAR